MNDQNPKTPDPESPGELSPSPAEPAPRQSGKKPRRILRTVLIAVILLSVIAAAVGGIYLHRWRSGAWTPGEGFQQALHSLADSTALMEKARALKGDLKELAECLRSMDASGAEAARSRLRQDADGVRAELDSPLIRAASSAPGVSDELRTAETLLELLDEADGALIAPCIDLIREHPLSAMNSDAGIRVDTLRAYLDFMEQALPEAEQLAAQLDGLDLSLIDSEGKLDEYREKLAPLLETASAARRYLPAARAVLGDGSDRLYLFAAQNSSELRASGGFPGSVGLVRIRDGLLTLSDFQSVYDVLQQATPRQAGFTYVEEQLFSGRLHLSWDSDFSPDFERVASIWAMAYEARNREPLDGVISGTPAIIPRLLSIFGSVTLSDGTELNGDNAARVLGHDLYFKYLGARQQAGAARYVDGLFSEAAVGTLHLVLSRINAQALPALLRFVEESVADRTLMVWMADESEQQLIREAGWDAGLNRDPMRPAAGIFFNSTAASKVSWFLNIEPELSEPVVNEDGSRSYELTVRFVNTMTPEERSAASGYILGGDGSIVGSVYVFAPAGGRIEDAKLASNYPMLREVYEDLELAYMLEAYIGLSTPYVIRCRITTAPGAEEPMTLMITPTMQNYR